MELQTKNPKVAGSIPAGRTKIIRVSKSPRSASRGHILSSLMCKQGIALSIVGIVVLTGQGLENCGFCNYALHHIVPVVKIVSFEKA